MREPHIGPDMRKASFRRTNYLGGHPARPKAIGGGLLTFDRAGVHMTSFMEKPFEFGWPQVARLAVESREEVQRRATATRLIAMGLPFAAPQALAASGFVVVTTSAGDAIFESPVGVDELRAALQPAMRWVEERYRPESRPSTSEGTHREIEHQIAKLSKLRGDGVLTDAEFEYARARLLASTE